MPPEVSGLEPQRSWILTSFRSAFINIHDVSVRGGGGVSGRGPSPGSCFDLQPRPHLMNMNERSQWGDVGPMSSDSDDQLRQKWPMRTSDTEIYDLTVTFTEELSITVTDRGSIQTLHFDYLLTQSPMWLIRNNTVQFIITNNQMKVQLREQRPLQQHERTAPPAATWHDLQQKRMCHSVGLLGASFDEHWQHSGESLTGCDALQATGVTPTGAQRHHRVDLSVV